MQILYTAEQAVFAAAQCDQSRRFTVQHLATEFTANTAAGAGDQYTSPTQQRANSRQIDSHRRTAKQVIQLHLT